jgi:hypothetical protein
LVAAVAAAVEVGPAQIQVVAVEVAAQAALILLTFHIFLVASV